MGMDGSGKSTLAKCLINDLHAKGFHVKYTWWLEGESTLLRKIIRSGLNVWKKDISASPGSIETLQSGKNKKSIFLMLYPRLVLLDYLIFGIMKTRILGRAEIVVFDRYYYDVLFALSKEFQLPVSTQSYFLSAFKRFIPDPDLIFILNVSPEIAYGRKKEEFKTLENAYLTWNRSNTVYEFVESNTHATIMKVDNSREIELSRYEMLNATLKILMVH